MENYIKKAKTIKNPIKKDKEQLLFNKIKSTKGPLRLKYLKLWSEFVDKNTEELK